MKGVNGTLLLSVVVALLAVLGLYLAPVAYESLEFMGFFHDASKKVNTDKCVMVKDKLLQGCEQVRIHGPSRKAFLVCTGSLEGRRRAFANPDDPNHDPEGELVVFDLETQEYYGLGAYPAGDRCNPLGMHVITDPNDASKVLVGVVNLLPGEPAIDVFEHVLGSKSATRIGRYSHRILMNFPDDVVLLDRETFYVTNLRRYSTGILSVLEILARRPWSKVLMYTRATGFQVVAEDLYMANGLAISNDRTELYVAATGDPALIRFQIQPGQQRLRQLERIPIHFGGDNVNLDPAGKGDTFYVAGHPHPMKLLAFMAPGSTTMAPSLVIKIQPNRGQDAYLGKRWNITTLFADDGTLLPGSSGFAHDSTASPLSLISGVASEGILVCRDLA